MLLTMLAMACRDKDSTAESPADSPVDSRSVPTRITGDREDEGFGAALALEASGVLWVGAPFGDTGRVYRVEGLTPRVVLEETERGGLGYALALADALLAGAPLAAGGSGRVVDGGGEVLVGGAGALVGGRLAASGDRWATTTAQGVRLGEEALELGQRPGGLAFDRAGTLYVGLPAGEGGFATPSATLAVGAAREEVGFAACVADLDLDGREDLALGAPGAGRVYVIPIEASGPAPDELRALTVGSGRFGAALACADGELWVGAPTWGPEASGGVWRVSGADLLAQAPGDPLVEGEPGSDFGAALVVGEALWVGAPGQDEVWRIAL